MHGCIVTVFDWASLSRIHPSLHHRVWLPRPIKTAAQMYIRAAIARPCVLPAHTNLLTLLLPVCVCVRGAGVVILQQAETPCEDAWQKMNQAEKWEEGEPREERAAAHGKHMSSRREKKTLYRCIYRGKKGKRRGRWLWETRRAGGMWGRDGLTHLEVLHHSWIDRASRDKEEAMQEWSHKSKSVWSHRHDEWTKLKEHLHYSPLIKLRTCGFVARPVFE